MNKNALLYYQSALDLGLPVKKIKEIDGFKIVLGKQCYFFRGGETPFNCGSSVSIASNKYCTNKLLEAAGFPTPKATAFSKEEFKKLNPESFIENFNFPFVVKPTTGATGKDVLCNIHTIEELTRYMKKCYKKYDFLSIEEFHANLNSYRVLIFYNKVIGVVQRFPASVVGDGIHTIEELIVLHNKEREQLKETVSLGFIKVDEECHIRLKELKMTLATVPKANETIMLCYTCNSTRGGTMKSLGAAICKENARLLRHAAKTLGLNIVGFDVACEDILTPIEKSRGVIIEANHNPDISIHEHPIYGIPHRVSKKILKRLILRQPFSYLLGCYQHKRSGFYIKSSFIIFMLITMKLFLS